MQSPGSWSPAHPRRHARARPCPDPEHHGRSAGSEEQIGPLTNRGQSRPCSHTLRTRAPDIKLAGTTSIRSVDTVNKVHCLGVKDRQPLPGALTSGVRGLTVQPMESMTTVGLDDAMRIINAGIVKSQEIYSPSNIAVADAGGDLTAHVRMDGAQLGSIEHSINKAYTSVLFRKPTGDLASDSQPGGSSGAWRCRVAGAFWCSPAVCPWSPTARS